MPVITSSLSFLYLSLMMPAVAVVAMEGAHNDMAAVLGAMFAAVIVVFDFQAKSELNRKITQFLPIFMASGFIGSVGPGITFHTFFPDIMERITWHGWAGIGFLYSLAGWVLVKYTMGFFASKLPDLIDNALPKWVSKKDSDK
jgi:hypothetical protein